MNEEEHAKLSGKRIDLAKQLPLEVPLSLQICITECCNLRCEFCLHGTEKATEYPFETMPVEYIHKLVDDFYKNNKKVKQILISGIGEPLIHRDIIEIVKALHKISEKIGIVSNGTLLNEKVSEDLLEAGLDILRISINGLTKEDYIKYTNTQVDPKVMQRNIKYFHEQAQLRNGKGKSPCLTYVKIMNYMVDTDEKRKIYFDSYQNISDLVNVENLNAVSPDVKYKDIADVDLNLTRRGTRREEVQICPRPFYEAVVAGNGDVLACCHDFWLNPHATVMGNIKDQNFLEIWNSPKFNYFRTQLLKFGAQGANETCSKCLEWQPMVSQSDILDSEARDLVGKYEV
jgi:MoaA/NifB/PqqE/SkfB family radical SAM enzyme